MTDRDGITKALMVLVPMVKDRYRDVDQDRLRAVLTEVLIESVGDHSATPDSLIDTLDQRVNKVLRS